MILSAILASVCLLAATPNVEHSLEVIRAHHLETADGRISFLNDALRPFVSKADALNQEIEELSERVSQIELDEKSTLKEEIVLLTQELTQKMGVMLDILPTLKTALRVDADFQQIDAILSKDDPLDAAEEAVVERIATLCASVDAQLFQPDQLDE